MLIVTGERETALLLKNSKTGMLYLGYMYALLRYVLIYNLEVSFNYHLTFLRSNVINVHRAVKTVFYLTLAYFLRAPDNSNSR